MKNIPLPSILMALFCGLIIGYFRSDGSFNTSDLIAYKPASELFFAGKNPYNSDQMRDAESVYQNEKIENPMMVWNPPILFLLFGPYFSLDTKYLMLISPMLSVVSGMGLALLGGYAATFCARGRVRHPALNIQAYLLILVISFFPVASEISCLQFSTTLSLVIVLGFLFYFLRWDIISGVCLSLALIKPHILFLPLILLGIWIVREKRFRIILGCLTAIAVGVLFSELFNPGIVEKWLFREQWPTNYLGSSTTSLTIRIMFMMGIGEWYRYALITPAVILLAYLFWRGKRLLNRSMEELIWAFALSPFVTPYGFLFDQTMLILVAIYLFAISTFTKGPLNPALYSLGILSLFVNLVHAYSNPEVSQLTWYIYPVAICAMMISYARSQHVNAASHIH